MFTEMKVSGTSRVRARAQAKLTAFAETWEPSVAHRIELIMIRLLATQLCFGRGQGIVN